MKWVNIASIKRYIWIIPLIEEKKTAQTVIMKFCSRDVATHFLKGILHLRRQATRHLDQVMIQRSELLYLTELFTLYFHIPHDCIQKLEIHNSLTHVTLEFLTICYNKIKSKVLLSSWHPQSYPFCPWDVCLNSTVLEHDAKIVISLSKCSKCLPCNTKYILQLYLLFDVVN